mgnify:FL=1
MIYGGGASNLTNEVVKIGLLKEGKEKSEYDLTDYVDLNHSESYMSSQYGNVFVLYSKLPRNLRRYYITTDTNRLKNIRSLIVTSLNIKLSTIFTILGLNPNMFSAFIFRFELPETFSSVLIKNSKYSESFIRYWNKRLQLDSKNQLISFH